MTQRRLDGFAARKPDRGADAPDELKMMLQQQLKERNEAKEVISKRDGEYQMLPNDTDASTMDLDGQVMQSLRSLRTDMQYLQGLMNGSEWTQETKAAATQRVFAKIREAIDYVDSLGPQLGKESLAGIVAQRVAYEEQLPAMRAHYQQQLQRHEQLLIQQIKAKQG